MGATTFSAAAKRVQMGLRRRRADQSDAPEVPAAAPVTASSSKNRGPTSSPTSSSSSRASRARFALAVIPLLGLSWLYLTRTSGPKQLPSHFAICSPRNGSQIITMDESDGGARLRVQCVVFDAGKVVGRGSLAEVRSEWGDLDTTGKGIGRRGGVRIHYIKHGQTVLPGLYASAFQSRG